jgi:hypothetical protein
MRTVRPVTFEPIAGIIRVGATWGYPFQYAMTVVGDEGVATLKGLASTGDIKPDDFAAIAAVLREPSSSWVGFQKMRWMRHRHDGTIQEKWFRTDRPSRYEDLTPPTVTDADEAAALLRSL